MSRNPARKYWNFDRRKDITGEAVFRDRRQIIRQFAAAGAGAIASGSLVSRAAIDYTDEDRKYHIPEHPLSKELYPAKVNETFRDPGRPLTSKLETFIYNNFYEFSLQKNAYRYVGPFEPFPWQVEVTGLCNQPKKWDIDELLRAIPLEERAYRFRCVEAWAMTVPWTGFALSELIKRADPKSEARYVRFETFHDPEKARGQKFYTDYTWPYFEGLHIEEAMHPLAFIATGMYGKNLPKQSGAPLRLILPWKYGYKGPKSIVKIEFVDKQPDTFWNLAYAEAYGFYSNVNPEKPHPNWSQKTERLLGTEERVETKLYNGYEEELAELHRTLYKNGEVF